MDKKNLIIITGPTAVGKTALSIKLAKLIGGEIISADSMQVYRYMDIGSAKIKKEEMEGVTHHLINILNPEEEFNVFIFKKLAKACLQEIYDRGHVPIIAGGTGFYIQALLYDIDFTEEENKSDIRLTLESQAAENGNVFLHELLKKLDPVSAEIIHPNNTKRLIRALEYYELTGVPISQHNKEEREKESPYLFSYFVLNDERSRLYERIDKRVDHMIADGFLNEVRILRNMGYHKNMVSMQGLGYQELLSFLDGEISLDEAIYLIKRDTRHFAKRQLTWFRRERDIKWIHKYEFNYNDNEMLKYMTNQYERKLYDN